MLIEAKWKAIFLSRKLFFHNFFFASQTMISGWRRRWRGTQMENRMTGNWTHFQFEVLMNELFTWKRVPIIYTGERTTMWRWCQIAKLQLTRKNWSNYFLSLFFFSWGRKKAFNGLMYSCWCLCMIIRLLIKRTRRDDRRRRRCKTKTMIEEK